MYEGCTESQQHISAVIPTLLTRVWTQLKYHFDICRGVNGTCIVLY
jgi:hypothetical protein